MKTHLKPHRLQNHPPESRSPNLLPENTTHWRPQAHSQLEFVQTQIAPVWVHDPIVMHHSNHQAAGESMPVEESNRGHGVSQQAMP